MFISNFDYSNLYNLNIISHHTFAHSITSQSHISIVNDNNNSTIDQLINSSRGSPIHATDTNNVSTIGTTIIDILINNDSSLTTAPTTIPISNVNDHSTATSVQLITLSRGQPLHTTDTYNDTFVGITMTNNHINNGSSTTTALTSNSTSNANDNGTPTTQQLSISSRSASLHTTNTYNISIAGSTTILF